MIKEYQEINNTFYKAREKQLYFLSLHIHNYQFFFYIKNDVKLDK